MLTHADACLGEQVRMLKMTEDDVKHLLNRENIVWVTVDAKPMKQARKITCSLVSSIEL
jgi:hypothetical protein